ncbi:MAG: Rha family transcriptional regulator [Magnetococcales bacterium]|nr:Rha family transcriptional regulator [Magnetococcales bacterium]
MTHNQPLPASSYSLVVCDESGELWTDSLTIAEAFDRQHSHVLRSIDQLIDDGTLNQSNFGSVKYLDAKGEARRMIRLDERGFLIAMPFIGGRKAREGQVMLVDAFLTLRRQLGLQTESRLSVTENRLAAIEIAMFADHPHWPTILQCKSARLTHRQVCEHTGHKSTDTIRRNLRRMERYGMRKEREVR